MNTVLKTNRVHFVCLYAVNTEPLLEYISSIRAAGAWLVSNPSLPEVCWEKIGDARNRRNPHWNTSSSFDLIGSVFPGCLRTNMCTTDI